MHIEGVHIHIEVIKDVPYLIFDEGVCIYVEGMHGCRVTNSSPPTLACASTVHVEGVAVHVHVGVEVLRACMGKGGDVFVGHKSSVEVRRH
jgi:hypothetical protein